MSTLNISVAQDQILSIVREVFSAMLDGGEVCVFEVLEPQPIPDPIYAWVDMRTVLHDIALSARALVHTDVRTAHLITRTLLMMDEAEGVSAMDLTDAFGEIANVVGGNVKSLLEVPASLSLPQVSQVRGDAHAGVFIQDLHVTWRGFPLTVSLWDLTNSSDWS